MIDDVLFHISSISYCFAIFVTFVQGKSVDYKDYNPIEKILHALTFIRSLKANGIIIIHKHYPATILKFHVNS